MTLKKTFSLLLALTLILGVFAPCVALNVNAKTTLYGGNLEQVTEPVVGESYYLGADVEGTMMYFRHGTVTDTVPYSLVVTDNIDHNWCYKLTLEDSTATSEQLEGYFQFTYANPSNGNTARIYCMDVLKDATVEGQTGVMDTGVNSSTPYQNRHSFGVEELEGTTIIRKYGNNNVLVIKQVPQSVDGEETLVWRMLGVDEEELGNDGVYPVMLLTEHNHSYGDAVVDGVIASRTCSSCGYVQSVYDNKVVSVESPEIGGSYHLTANVDGTIRYFIHGTVSETSPASLRTSDDLDHSWAFPVVLEEPVEGDEGFQMTYTNPSGTDVRIYCYDSIGEDGVVDTGVNTKSELAKHTFKLDEVDGVQVIRKIDNNCVLVVKELEYSRSVTDADGNTTTQTGTELRILGVDESELANEGVYPVFLTEEHTHIACGTAYQISDSGHGAACWCGGYAAETAHTYGDVTHNDDDTHTRACTVCGYEQVIYGQQYVQIKNPTVGKAYYLAANVDGQLLSFYASGGYTKTTPYSIGTTESIYAFTLNTALESGKGEFQLVNEAGYYVYSIAAGAGMTQSTSYIGNADRVSFLADEVDGVSVIRAYGTNNILAVKYSDDLSAWRVWAVEESELANEGVYPVVLLDTHEHIYGAWSELSENYTQTHTCTVCGHVETMLGADDKAILVEEPVIGDSYYLVANVNGTLRYFLHSSPTETVPYSMRTTDDITHKWAFQVTLEDSTVTDEGLEGHFQFTYTNPTTGNTARIYCMDVLKDATVEGQTGVMDTGVNSSTPYQNRHSFGVEELEGTTVIRKYGNENILVVKELEYSRSVTDADGNTTTQTGTEWRLLGVSEDKLANEGVYPVVLADAHTHTFGQEIYGDETGHWNLCDCGSKSEIQAHTVESWTVTTPPSETEPGSKSGVCTVCGETAVSAMEVSVQSWNIVLSDKIGVNFVLALTEGDSISVTVGGNEVPVTVKEDGTAFIELAAAQMKDEIVITVNNYTVEKTYCVRDYADVILAGEEYTSYTKSLIENMLAYGGAAQTYFGYNTGNLASEGIEVSVTMPTEVPEIEVIDELENIQYYGATIVHEAKTAVRFYFVADSVEGLTFTVDGNVYEPVSKNGKFYIEISDINPQSLADTLNVVVTDGTNNLAVAYSPLTYMVRMYHNAYSTDANKALVQAMYGYYAAAKSYMANLGLADDFAVKSVSESTLYEGVTLSEKVYVAAGYGEVEAYILTVEADANVELKVSAGEWDETNDGDNPAEAMTVANHFRSVKNAGYNVLATINGGFFDLNNTGSNLPYGTQIVDGVVKQAPSADANNYSNNWFGMTTDGQYVIADAAAYESTYVGNVQQAVGGGKLLIVDGVPAELTSERAYRTAVGVNANGDLVIVAVANATYSDVCHIFVDMDMDILTVLNLDGGGSTAMYVPGTYYPKALILGEDGILPREVADAVAIVEK